MPRPTTPLVRGSLDVAELGASRISPRRRRWIFPRPPLDRVGQLVAAEKLALRLADPRNGWRLGPACRPPRGESRRFISRHGATRPTLTAHRSPAAGAGGAAGRCVARSARAADPQRDAQPRPLAARWQTQLLGWRLAGRPLEHPVRDYRIDPGNHFKRSALSSVAQSWAGSMTQRLGYSRMKPTGVTWSSPSYGPAGDRYQ
jgi:hypothetical protein